MATISERNGRFTAQIRRKKKGMQALSLSKTFGTREEAECWAAGFSDKSLDGLMQPKLAALDLRVHRLPRLKATTGVVGIYFLFRDDVCVYVGQSTDVHGRVRSHKLQREGLKDFDSYALIPVDEDDLDSVETYYIRALQPEFNKCEVGGARNSRRSRQRAAGRVDSPASATKEQLEIPVAS